MNKKSTFVIVGAMPGELAPLAALLGAAENAFGDREADVGAARAVLCECGPGKVNAALCAQKAILRYAPDALINIGIAGGLDPAFALCGVIACRDCVYHDFSPVWVLDKYPPHCQQMPADPRLLGLAGQACERLGFTAYKVGRAVSGDAIVTDAAYARRLRDELAGDCVDMESAALAHVCLVNDVPFLALRAVSDFADESALGEMERQEYRASDRLAKITKEIISIWEEKQE